MLEASAYFERQALSKSKKKKRSVLLCSVGSITFPMIPGADILDLKATIRQATKINRVKSAIFHPHNID